jgi:hypothetical protein
MIGFEPILDGKPGWDLLGCSVYRVHTILTPVQRVYQFHHTIVNYILISLNSYSSLPHSKTFQPITRLSLSESAIIGLSISN